MVSYVDIMGLCQSVAILLEIYGIWPLNVIWGGITYISSECKLRDFLNRFSFLPSFIWWREKKTITMSYIRLHFLINQSWIMFITLYTLLDLNGISLFSPMISPIPSLAKSITLIKISYSKQKYYWCPQNAKQLTIFPLFR